MTQPRGRARELSILRVVMTLIGEVGYERLTVDAVAARARASKATIYARWPDKAALVAAAINARSLDQRMMGWDGDSLGADLREFFDLCVHLAETESLDGFVSMLVAAGSDSALAKAVQDTALAPRRAECDQILERARGRGEIDERASGEDLFELVLGQILVRYVLERRPIGAETRASYIEKVLFPALGAGSTSSQLAR
ncbi:TetR-like C-terminal domain-containing protein [Nocardia asteroides]